MGVVSVIRSLWALAYAALSIATLLQTTLAITGLATGNRIANAVLTVLNNQMSEMPLIAIVLEAGFYIFLRATGIAHTSTLVQFANFLNLLTVAGVLYLLKRSFDAKREAELFLQRLAKESKNHIQLPGFTSPRFWKQLLDPRHSPQNCFVHENIPYWTSNEQMMVMEADGLKSVLDMALDVYRPTSAEGGDDRPVFVHIHGGGWTSGSKSLTGPLLTELISRQWIVVSVDYRLHSKAGYPSQLIDCKRALRWVKDEIRIFGGNPRNVIVGGDSAGGHLAALLALTPNQPEYQPGFEHVDTSVQGCVPQSASFDLVDLKNYSYHGARERFIKEVTRREGAADSPENIEFLMEHSPLFRIKESSIPFLVTQVNRSAELLGDPRRSSLLPCVPITKDLVYSHRGGRVA
ncbi:hypothetical protein BGZ98_003626 [Dissophora globulifera]|nr:hypothetical protein BGZ98_003626 [Dissophora globulifera]